MPITYDIDSTGVLLTIVLEGDVTLAELKAYFEETDRDPRLHGDLRRLVVSSGITGFPLYDDLDQLRSMAEKRDGQTAGKLAVVATTPLSIGTTNMFFRSLGLGDSFEIFPDRDRATMWLMRDSARVRD